MQENLTLPNVLSAYISAAVEQRPLDETLKEVGLSEEFLLNQWIAPQNSGAARDYCLQRFRGEAELRKDGEDFYFVKKVFCGPQDYESMAEAVSADDTDKFKVLRLIGSNERILGYKGDSPGLEAYLVSGKNASEALKNAEDTDPAFYYRDSRFNAAIAREVDSLVTDAIYTHSPESITKVLEIIQG